MQNILLHHCVESIDMPTQIECSAMFMKNVNQQADPFHVFPLPFKPLITTTTSSLPPGSYL